MVAQATPLACGPVCRWLKDVTFPWKAWTKSRRVLLHTVVCLALLLFVFLQYCATVLYGMLDGKNASYCAVAAHFVHSVGNNSADSTDVTVGGGGGPLPGQFVDAHLGCLGWVLWKLSVFLWTNSGERYCRSRTVVR